MAALTKPGRPLCPWLLSGFPQFCAILGLVVLTGCAHAGILNTVHYAREISGVDRVWAILGGFHLGGKSRKEIEGILSEFRRLGVRKVAPCHCTGEQAIRMFHQEYGEDFIQAGVGKVIRVPEPLRR